MPRDKERPTKGPRSQPGALCPLFARRFLPAGPVASAAGCDPSKVRKGSVLFWYLAACEWSSMASGMLGSDICRTSSCGLTCAVDRFSNAVALPVRGSSKFENERKCVRDCGIEAGLPLASQ